MAYEYDCPQFVDFLSVPEGSPTNTYEKFLPSRSPYVKRELGAFKVPKPVKSTQYTSTARKTETNTAHPTNITDSMKLNVRNGLSKRFSKSENVLTIVHKPMLKRKLEFSRKKSLSESDIRPKKRAMATTPMCLKRTIQNVKARKFKTTEEMELEKIAELQNQTRKHLRANEISMRRQKMKQTGNPIREIIVTQKKEVKVKTSQQDYNFVLEKLDKLTQNVRENRKKVEVKKPSNLYEETMKKINNLAKANSNSSNSFVRELVAPVVPQDVSDDPSGRMSMAAVMKQLPVKKVDSHCGLLFKTSQRKFDVRPFNFQNVCQAPSSTCKYEPIEKPKVESLNSMETPKLVINKENVPWKRTNLRKY